jgi:hypothetical protein
MTQPHGLPVAGLHRASPSATLDKSSCQYALLVVQIIWSIPGLRPPVNVFMTCPVLAPTDNSC